MAVGQRAYTDEEVGNAVAAVAASGGYVKPTAARLGIPSDTLDNWVKGTARAAVAELVPSAEEVAQDAAKAHGSATKDIVELAEAFLRLSKAAAERALETIHTASPYHASLISGISLDKWALITGRPTSRSEVRTIRYVEPAALRTLAQRVIDVPGRTVSGTPALPPPRVRRARVAKRDKRAGVVASGDTSGGTDPESVEPVAPPE